MKDVWGRNTDVDDEKVKVMEAAEFLECTTDRILELLREGQLPGIKYGKSWVIPRAAFFDSVNVSAVQAQAVLSEAAMKAKMPTSVSRKRPGRTPYPRGPY